jgi:hypothetical protein
LDPTGYKFKGRSLLIVENQSILHMLADAANNLNRLTQATHISDVLTIVEKYAEMLKKALHRIKKITLQQSC